MKTGERETIAEHLKKSGVSRRSFLQLCSTLIVAAPVAYHFGAGFVPLWTAGYPAMHRARPLCFRERSIRCMKAIGAWQRSRAVCSACPSSLN